MYTPEQALERLKEGNARYLEAGICPGDISPRLRRETAETGQSPYAVVISCSDSRVIPECIFSAGLGELFVIRVAGNVIDNHQLGSIEYAAAHLGTRLIVMLGHTRCGAVEAALSGHSDGLIDYIVRDINEAVGDETDPDQACRLNVLHGVARIKSALSEHMRGRDAGLAVVGAVYHIEDGRVEFLPDRS